jgi:hypothetical protein
MTWNTDTQAFMLCWGILLLCKQLVEFENTISFIWKHMIKEGIVIVGWVPFLPHF